MADNVDHNIRTIDGLNTFHGMGIIATVTPSTQSTSKVPRISVTMEDVAAVGRINIRHPTSPCRGLDLKYELLKDNKEQDKTSHFDLLWKISLTVRSPRPSWSGMMQAVHKGTYPGQSSVIFLPMIDLNPGDISCIYSTLLFVCDHAKCYNATPIITFDQPLWWKALTIIENEPEDSELHGIVLRLGGFHSLMSFLGAIGHIMAGSGLRRCLELIYAENTVTHMMTGKVYDRAFRGHLLMDAALNTMLASTAFGTLVPITCISRMHDNSDGVELETNTNFESVVMEHKDDESSEEINMQLSSDVDEIVSSDMDSITVDLHEVEKLYDSLVEKEVALESAFSKDIFERIDSLTKKATDSLKHHRTAQLWMTYMRMVDIMRNFIKSERTGDWNLHVQTLHDMLPYLAAAGHNLYTKSMHIYLQQLTHLPVKHPEVQQHFENGFHVVRR